MARIKFIPRRQAKDEKQTVTKSELTYSNSGRIRDLNDTTSVLSSTPTQPSKNMSNVYYKRFGKEENQSTMALYAKMSTTIAKTLPEEEFGSQKNPNYRPNASYSSKVIFPVECKRDIFVESVAPAKNRKSRRGSGKHSIYQVNVGREQSPYNEIRNVHMASPSHRAMLGASNISLGTNKPLQKSIEVQDIGCEERPFDEKDDESLTLTYSTDEEKENEKVQQNISRHDKVMNGKTTLSVQTSHAFLNKGIQTNSNTLEKHTVATRHISVASGANSAGTGALRIETRTNVLSNIDEDNYRPSNKTNRFHARAHAYGKSRLQPLQSNHVDLNDDFSMKQRPSIQRAAIAAMEVSPSSTVSSLTLPAELEYSTPREVFHSIALPMIIEDDVVLGEI